MEKEEGELCRTVVVAFDVTFSQWESRFNSSSVHMWIRYSTVKYCAITLSDVDIS